MEPIRLTDWRRLEKVGLLVIRGTPQLIGQEDIGRAAEA